MPYQIFGGSKSTESQALTASHTITTCVSANTQYSISFTNAILIEVEAKEPHTWRWSLVAGVVAANAAASAIVSYPDGEGIFSLALPAFHPWTGTIYVASATAGTNLNVLSWRLP